MSVSFEERVAGAAVGHALGDALGFQVERQAPEVTGPYARAWLLDGAGPERMRDGFAMGQVSDDAQCVHATMRAVVGAGLYDEEAVAAALAGIRADMVGPGRTVRSGLDYLVAHGGPLREALLDRAARDVPNPPTNGAAMRAWVVGAGPREGLRERAALCARITHDDPDAVGAAVVAAVAVALLLDGTPLAGLMDAVAVEVGDCPSEARVVALARRLASSPTHLAHGIAWEASGHDPKWRSVSPMAVPTVAWSLRSACLRGEDPAAAMVDALDAGGDVDTVAGLVGAMCGAAHGPAAFPAALVARVTDRGRWDAAGHAALAREFARAMRPAGFPRIG